MSLSKKILFLFLFSIRLQAADYEFTTDNFQLGRWNSKTLSYAQGRKKIEVLDKWFNGLPKEKRAVYRESYSLNRNRLFLVTQEKRLRSELDQQPSLFELAKDQVQPSWIAAGRNVINQDKREAYSKIKALNETALNDEKALSFGVIGSLADIGK